MTTTIQTIRTAAAAFMFAAFLAGTLAPGNARAHWYSGWTYPHEPDPPVFSVRRSADAPQNSIVVTWPEAHYHPNWHRNGTGQQILLDYRIYVRDAREEQLDPGTCGLFRPQEHLPDGCIRRIVSIGSKNYSETIGGLRPDRTYYVWMVVSYRKSGYDETLSRSSKRHRPTEGGRRTITTLPAPSQTTPTPTAGHTHNYAAPGHSHSVPNHSHPVANHRHGYATAAHTHSYAAANHTHDGTGTATPAAAAPGGSQTCPRFVELEDPWTYKSSYARGPIDGSVWIAVDAIEYMMERTVAATHVYDVVAGETTRRTTGDLEGVEIRLKVSHAPSNAGNPPRSFIVEGAALADVVSSVRCTTGAVTTTGGAPAPE